MPRMRALASVLGRLAMSGIFLEGGWAAFSQPDGRTKAAERIGLPDPEAMVKFNGLAMVAGGTALALGRWRRAAPIGLIASLAMTSIAGHAFWREQEPQARDRQKTQFLKNLGLIGGLLIMLSKTPARESA